VHLDARDACSGDEDALSPVVPADAQTLRLLAQYLFDGARATGLTGTLGLDHEPVADVNTHDWIHPQGGRYASASIDSTVEAAAVA
jgi:hypothetical protein